MTAADERGAIAARRAQWQEERRRRRARVLHAIDCGRSPATVLTAGFARGHRMIEVPNAVIAMATIQRAGVFFFSNDRGEREVVLDPARLRNVIIHAATERAGFTEAAE